MRTIVLILALFWLGMSIVVMPDLIRATASAGNARLEAIQRLQQRHAPASEAGNYWF